MRQQYKWGAKQFLATMEVGERLKIDTELFNYRGMQTQANALKKSMIAGGVLKRHPQGGMLYA